MFSYEHQHTHASTHHDAPPPLPWLAWKKGDRVVIRRREADGLYDALGEVLDVCADYVRVRTRKGDVTVPATKMVTGKKVPPPPLRDV